MSSLFISLGFVKIDFDILKDQVTPYNSTKSKKEQVSEMFDNIAPTYDFLNHFLSLGIDISWRKKAILQTLAYDPATVLDIATGTGDMAVMIAKKSDNAVITGVDISENMLNYGRQKVKKQSLEERITLEVGDAENLNFADNTFDAACVSFGVRNFEHLEKGLTDIFRVLKQGGRFVVLEFSRPKVFPLKQAFNFYFKNILPLIGKLQSKDPKAYQYLFESVQAFPEGENFKSILQKVGFKVELCKPLTFGICHLYVGEK